MKRQLIALLVPCWFGCGGVVDLGAVDETKTDSESAAPFEPALVQFAPWNHGMCGLFSDEKIRCWRFGDADSAREVNLTGIAFAGVAGERGVLCAVQRSGRIACVEDDCYEHEGPCWFTKAPFEIPKIESAVDVALNGGGVALLSDGRIQRWLGDGSIEVEAPIGTAEPITRIPRHVPSGFVTADGHAYSTGVVPIQDFIIPVLQPAETYNANWPPSLVLGIDDAVVVAGGGEGSYVLRRSGNIFAVGWAPVLGIDRDDNDLAVGEVTGIDDAVAIESNGFSACAIRVGGSLWCWGNGMSGALGVLGSRGEYGEYSVTLRAPFRVPTVEGVRGVGMVDHMTCVVRGSNEVSCWGWRGADVEPTLTPYRIHFR